MNKLKVFTGIVLLVFAINLNACKTTQKFQGKTELTVFIVDENDKPVTDVEVSLKNNMIFEGSGTNQNGFCFFSGIPAGEYEIISKKTGYTDSQVTISFLDRTEVFCIKIMSADYVFDQAEVLFEQEFYEKAVELLKKINTGRNTGLQNAKSFYLAYGLASLQKRWEANQELRKIKAEPPFDDSALKYKTAIQEMLK